METQLTLLNENKFTDVTGLRHSGIFPEGKEPSVRTLRSWTKLRRIPYHRLGHFIYYDPSEVAAHIRTKLKSRRVETTDGKLSRRGLRSASFLLPLTARTVPETTRHVTLLSRCAHYHEQKPAIRHA